LQMLSSPPPAFILFSSLIFLSILFLLSSLLFLCASCHSCAFSYRFSGLHFQSFVGSQHLLYSKNSTTVVFYEVVYIFSLSLFCVPELVLQSGVQESSVIYLH
jgi:hypothetical protein